MGHDGRLLSGWGRVCRMLADCGVTYERDQRHTPKARDFSDLLGCFGEGFIFPEDGFRLSRLAVERPLESESFFRPSAAPSPPAREPKGHREPHELEPSTRLPGSPTENIRVRAVHEHDTCNIARKLMRKRDRL